jgi:hypothetical protein
MVPPVEICQNAVGQLVLVTDCHTRTLQDRFQECVSQHQPGIPRFELLRYLAAAAEALDGLYWRTEMTHLGLNPRTLAFHNARLVMDQFGYAELAWLLAGQVAGPPNGRYAAPELAQAVGSSAADQYSLALIYAEMLTGVHPRPEVLRSRRGRGTWEKLSLEFIPATDRDIVACALDNDPDKRFASCSDFVQALKRATIATRDAARLPGRLFPVVPYATLLGEPLSPSVDLPSVHELVTQQQLVELGAVQPLSCGQFHCTVAPNGALEHKLSLRSPSRMASLRLEGFRQHGPLQLVEKTDCTLSYRLNAPRNLWGKWIGQPQGLEIRLDMAPSASSSPEFTEATIRIEAFGGDLGTQMLRESGPEVIGNLRRFLQAGPERRGHPRWDFKQPVRVYPVFPDLELAEPIAGKGKDISLEGISLRLPQRPSASYFYLHLNTSAALARWVILAKILRVEAKEDGWFEIGAAFASAGEAHVDRKNGVACRVAETH